jgi:hypothetical protein
MSKTQMFDSTKTAFDKSELPVPEFGSMCYMLSKQQNFGPKYGNADPHLMFWFPQKDHMNWGADFLGSPVDVPQYSPQPITEFVIFSVQVVGRNGCTHECSLTSDHNAHSVMTM